MQTNHRFAVLALAVACSILTATVGYSQTTPTEVTFHLRSGSVITGIVVEEVPGRSYKLQTKDLNYFAIELADVVKITRPGYDAEKGNKAEAVQSKTKGYKGQIELGGMPMVLPSGQVLGTISGRAFNGVHLGRYLSIGGVLGFDVATTGDLHVPLQLQLNATPTQTKWSPLLSFALGYSAFYGPTISPNKGYLYNGFNINPAIGLEYRSSSRYTFSLKLGYMMAMTFQTSRISPTKAVGYHGVPVTIGFGF